MADVAKAALAEGDKWHRIIKDGHVSVACVGTFPLIRLQVGP
jgi:hypothetical protein